MCAWRCRSIASWKLTMNHPLISQCGYKSHHYSRGRKMGSRIRGAKVMVSQAQIICPRTKKRIHHWSSYTRPYLSWATNLISVPIAECEVLAARVHARWSDHDRVAARRVARNPCDIIRTLGAGGNGGRGFENEDRHCHRNGGEELHFDWENSRFESIE